MIIFKKLQLKISYSSLFATAIFLSGCTTLLNGNKETASTEPQGYQVNINDFYYSDTPMKTIITNDKYYYLNVMKGDTMKNFDKLQSLISDSIYRFNKNQFKFKFEILALSDTEKQNSNNENKDKLIINNQELDFYHPERIDTNHYDSEEIPFDKPVWQVSTYSGMNYKDVKIKAIVDSSLIIIKKIDYYDIPYEIRLLNIHQIKYFEETSIIGGGIIGALIGGALVLISPAIFNFISLSRESREGLGFAIIIFGPLLVIIAAIIGATAAGAMKTEHTIDLNGLNLNERKNLIEEKFKMKK
jgi:hypothetical protein